MREVFFCIKGRRPGDDGNPKPKLRMTRAQAWKPEVKEYQAWKAHVQTAFLAAVQADRTFAAACKRNIVTHGKPVVLEPEERALMGILICWKGGNHGDPENVFGSIADALFFQDKDLSGFFHVVKDVNEKPGATVDVKLVLRTLEELDILQEAAKLRETARYWRSRSHHIKELTRADFLPETGTLSNQ